MTIRHHLGDDLLLSYAAGSLAEGWSIAVATHLALCWECRQRLLLADATGGEMLDEIIPEGATGPSWNAVRARLGAAPAAAPARVQPATATIPQPLRDYIGTDIHGIKWQRLGKGAAQVRLKTGDTATQVRLLKIPAGKPVPEHSHGGRELTVVLSGAFNDGETVFARGDIEDADASIQHIPTATPDADCICLAVTDAPLRFRSWIVRALQPVLGI